MRTMLKSARMMEETAVLARMRAVGTAWKLIASAMKLQPTSALVNKL